MKKRNQRIVIYVRADADVFHIAKAIFFDRFYKKAINFYNYSWKEIEMIIDFLLSETKLSKIFRRTLGDLRYLQ